MFQHGYDPTQSMTEFHKHITSLKKVATPKRKKSSGATTGKSPSFSTGEKVNSDGKVRSRRYQFGAVNPHDVDTDDLDEDDYYQRPLADYEYIFPAGTAPKKIVKDKFEAVHESLRTNLSSESTIQSFYEDLWKRLKPKNIPLRDWNSLQPGKDVLDLVEDRCQNYANVKPVHLAYACQ